LELLIIGVIFFFGYEVPKNCVSRVFLGLFQLSHYIATDGKSLAEEHHLRLLETGLKID
jgi:hypothetical protein